MEPVQFGQYPPARRTILHLSDTHLLAGNRPLGGRYDTAANLARTLEAVERLDLRPDAIVFTGDLTDLGEPEAYAALRAAVEPVAARLSARRWSGSRATTTSGRRCAATCSGSNPPRSPSPACGTSAGCASSRSTRPCPGWHHGDLDAAQLDWLRGILSTPAPLGTLLALHHPPLPSHVPLFDILELRDQGRLAEAIAGSDVRGILAGHLHYSTSGTFAGVPVSVAAATCYTMNLARPAASVNGMDAGQSFHLVHVYDHTITHSVVPVVDAPTGEYFSPEWVARMAQLTPRGAARGVLAQAGTLTACTRRRIAGVPLYASASHRAGGAWVGSRHPLTPP